MATQIQIRGAAAATQQARTLSSRELDVDITNKRICVHDGSTVGGIPHVNYIDAQNQTYTYGAASGTDTITVNMAIAPNAYVTGQRFTFKAANTNTGSATLNINGLGAKTIKKKDIGSGTLIVLDAGDIIQGGIYTAFYDGTNMLLEAIDGGGNKNKSITAASSSEIEFTGLVINKHYRFILSNLTPSSDGDILYMRVSTDGGATYKTSSYTSTLGGSTASIYLTGTVGSSGYENANGTVVLYDPANPSYNTSVTFIMEYRSEVPTASYSAGGGRYSLVGAVNAVKFAFTGGTIESGTITLIEEGM